MFLEVHFKKIHGSVPISLLELIYKHKHYLQQVHKLFPYYLRNLSGIIYKNNL